MSVHYFIQTVDKQAEMIYKSFDKFKTMGTGEVSWDFKYGCFVIGVAKENVRFGTTV